MTALSCEIQASFLWSKLYCFSQNGFENSHWLCLMAIGNNWISGNIMGNVKSDYLLRWHSSSLLPLSITLSTTVCYHLLMSQKASILWLKLNNIVDSWRNFTKFCSNVAHRVANEIYLKFLTMPYILSDMHYHVKLFHNTITLVTRNNYFVKFPKV